MTAHSNKLCVQLGSTRTKATLWSLQNQLLDVSVGTGLSPLMPFLKKGGFNRVLVAGVNEGLCQQLIHEWPEPDQVRWIKHEDLRAYCDFPERDFKRVGIDRLLYVAGVSSDLAEESVCIDFGTYTTINKVSTDAKLCSGWILPGLNAWIQSAKNSAPQLLISVEPFCFVKPLTPSGEFALRNTMDAILGAFRQCYVGLFSQVVALRCPIFVTGGNMEMFQALLSSKLKRDPYWVERGMLKVSYEG